MRMPTRLGPLGALLCALTTAALAGCGDDDGAATDAALRDRALEPDAEEARACPPGCGDAGICEFMSCTATVGLCFERPTSCSNDFEPVCGCDGITYVNSCRRALAGARHAHRGECMNECVMAPRTGCCFDQADCDVGLDCYGVGSCSAGAEGRCLAPPVVGACWADSDCRGGTPRCVGASVCPCGASCLVADAPGTCAP